MNEEPEVHIYRVEQHPAERAWLVIVFGYAFAGAVNGMLRPGPWFVAYSCGLAAFVFMCAWLNHAIRLAAAGILWLFGDERL